MGSSTESFPPFARLPPELRRMIWAAALPLNDPASVYIYSPRCSSHFIAKYSKMHSHHTTNGGLCIQVAVPNLFYVNWEARHAVLDWADRHGIKERHCKEANDTVLARDWDPSKDALYIPSYHWHWFGDLQHVFDFQVSIKHLAVPADRAYHDTSGLTTLIKYMPGLETVYVVWGEVPSTPRHSSPQGPEQLMRQRQSQPPMHPRWELAPEGGRSGGVCFESAIDGAQTLREEGDISEWMGEVEGKVDRMQLPASCFDRETGELRIGFEAARAIKREVAW